MNRSRKKRDFRFSARKRYTDVVRNLSAFASLKIYDYTYINIRTLMVMMMYWLTNIIYVRIYGEKAKTTHSPEETNSRRRRRKKPLVHSVHIHASYGDLCVRALLLLLLLCCCCCVRILCLLRTHTI